MDVIRIGSLIYIIYLLISTGILLAVYFGGRKKSEHVKITILFVLAIVNLVQHFFKFLIWPHHYGTGFSIVNTAYNVCAFHIILTPFLIRKKSGALKEFHVYVGSVGCIGAFFYPSWFIGQTILQWEFLRFWTCHFLLLLTSLLPILWGMVKFERKNFWKIGLWFFAMLCIILVNDVLSIYMGLAGEAESLYETLYALNPLGIIHPPENAKVLLKIISYLSPPIFLGSNSGVYVPILWYMLPVYVGITLLAYGLGTLWELYERRNKLKIKQKR